MARMAQLPEADVKALSAELEALGAVHAQEVTVPDCEALRAYSSMRPFAQRRLLAAVRQLLRGSSS